MIRIMLSYERVSEIEISIIIALHIYDYDIYSFFIIFLEIDDVVGPVLFLLNDKMSGMVQGEKIFVDGGYNSCNVLIKLLNILSQRLNYHIYHIYLKYHIYLICEKNQQVNVVYARYMHVDYVDFELSVTSVTPYCLCDILN